MSAHYKVIAVGCLGLLAAGCSTPVPQALGPQDVPPAFTGPVAPGTAVWPNPDWWKGFGSDEMSGLVVQAQQDNLDLAVAMANVLQASANKDIARSALFPFVDATGSGQRARTAGQTTVVPTGTGGSTTVNTGSFTGNNFGLSLNASYEADIWGLAQDNLRAADEALKSARFAQQVVALSTTATVATTYMDILALREEIATIEQNIDAAKRILTVTQAKVTNGVSSQLDLSQQQATVAGQEAALPPLREQEREAVFALAILMGKPPEGFTVTGQNLDSIKVPAVGAGIPSALLERRPDVAEAEANLASAHANVDAARAAFFPAITLTGAGGLASTAIGTLFKASAFQWSIGANLLQTVFDGGKLIAESDLAKAQQQGLIATYRKSVISAYSDVETSLGQVSNFNEEEGALQREVDASANAFRISELQYREGIADILTVLQSQQTLFAAKNQLIQVKLARAQADVNLYKALGGGWNEDPADATQTTTPAAPPANQAPPAKG
ncbi:MAG TPA: efflux transporter outer membrane subunit [Rhizomicrobium sp.]|jgi:NodT family efflux transporter outer membrane factor (OMF) lipoprotein